MPKFEAGKSPVIEAAILRGFVTRDVNSGLLHECESPISEAWAQFACLTNRTHNKNIRIITDGDEWFRIMITKRGTIITTPKVVLAKADQEYLQGLIAEAQ